ncbi:MAG: hypothetical protein HOE54_06935 [Gammaproteobacteria bacterium]|nr:hypothetical protein [Gammaproteobacteria bacterium]
MGTTDSPYGYLIHNPDEASLSRDGKYPLLVFFHGGGNGILHYVNSYGSESYAAALLPISSNGLEAENKRYSLTTVQNGGSDFETSPKRSSIFDAMQFKETAVWGFINEAENYIGLSEEVRAINAINGISKITVYPKPGHDAWTRTYNMKGQGVERKDFDPFDQNIYEWLLEQRKQG